MKKIGIILFVIFGMSVLVAQKKEITHSSKTILTKAPKLINDKFSNEYPGVMPVWKLEGDKYQASFMNSETKLNHYVLYGRSGNIIAKESEMDYNDYPVVINQYYSRRFPEEKYRIIQCQALNGEKYYYSKRKNEIIKFDTSGNYISTR